MHVQVTPTWLVCVNYNAIGSNATSHIHMLTVNPPRVWGCGNASVLVHVLNKKQKGIDISQHASWQGHGSFLTLCRHPGTHSRPRPNATCINRWATSHHMILQEKPGTSFDSLHAHSWILTQQVDGRTVLDEASHWVTRTGYQKS